MNPKDIMNDAIHNFHPQYQQYTQYTTTNHHNSGLASSTPYEEETDRSRAAARKTPQPQNRQISTITQTYNEKSMLLSSDDEFQ